MLVKGDFCNSNRATDEPMSANQWEQGRKSVMVFNDPADGTLTGKYRSIVGGDPHIKRFASRTSSVEQGKQLLSAQPRGTNILTE